MSENEDEDVKDANFYDLFDFLDELDDNIVHEIPSHDPNKESLFLHKGNSIIID